MASKNKPPHFRLGARREGMNPQPQPEYRNGEAVGCNRGRVAIPYLSDENGMSKYMGILAYVNRQVLCHSHIFLSPQPFPRLVDLRHQSNHAVKYTSINPTFRGRDKQRIGQVIGTGFDHQGKDAERFADYWIDGNRWNNGFGRVVQQPSKCGVLPND